MTLKVVLADDRVQVGDQLFISFHRTLRVPDDGRQYPLPPTFGRLLMRCVEGRPNVFLVPMYQREAMWIGFDAAEWKPHAVKVGIGGVNVVSGQPWHDGMSDAPQDYVVCPPQFWLDGINAGNGFIRQFVAMPLGQGLTVEEQLTGRAEFGGVQLSVSEPKPGRFPERPPSDEGGPRAQSAFRPMGLGAGGRIRQKIYPDPYGLDTWDPSASVSLAIQLANSEEYTVLTGEPPPASPIDARAYTEQGLPWFDLYDEEMGDVVAPPHLRRVKSIRDVEWEHEGGADDAACDVSEAQLRKLPRKPDSPKEPR